MATAATWSGFGDVRRLDRLSADAIRVWLGISREPPVKVRWSEPSRPGKGSAARFVREAKSTVEDDSLLRKAVRSAIIPPPPALP